MFKHTARALLATTAFGLAATAHADIVWDWSFTTTSVLYGTSVSGGGTLTTGPLDGSYYPITGVTGTFAGNQITSLSNDGGANNRLFTPGGNGVDNSFFDDNGLGLSDNTGDLMNIFDDGYPTYYANDIDDNYAVYGNFTAIPAAAPEPSQVISMLSLAGIGGAGMLRKLRRRK